jgi:hypothetical protein
MYSRKYVEHQIGDEKCIQNVGVKIEIVEVTWKTGYRWSKFDSEGH